MKHLKPPVNVEAEPPATRRDSFADRPAAAPPPDGVKENARRQFDGWAGTYDRSIVQRLLFRPAYRMLMEELYRWRRGETEPFDVLDIGSGTGTWLAWIARSGLAARRLTGLDYSASMCGVARMKGLAVGEGAPVFVNGDSEHLPFADRSFDVVTCSNSFHHYPRQGAAVREMARVLRPGGRLMIVDGFRDNVIGWVLYDVLITRGESTPTAKVYHASWSQMRGYFAEAGLREIRQSKQGVWVPIFLSVGQK